MDEKQLNSWKKKYFFYEKDDIIIFNFDYNKIKPFVMSILNKKKYIENFNIAMVIMGSIILILFGIFTLLKVDSIKQEITKNKQEIESILS
jgi:hypothetical protein